MNDDAIIAKLIEKLRLSLGTELVGVIVGGSRLRGEQDNNSDLDVVVVVERPQRKRWNFVIDGVEVETFINPLAQMHRYFVEERDDGRGLMPHLCATGLIVLDTGGVMKSLQTEAQHIWRAGPPPFSDRERWQFRYHAADALRDIEDVIDADADRAAMLIGLLVPKLIDMHYRIAGRWLHKPKRVLLDLEIWDQGTARLVRKVQRAQVAAATNRASTVHELARHVLAPIGGPMPIEWEIEWGPAQGPT